MDDEGISMVTVQSAELYSARYEKDDRTMWYIVLQDLGDGEYLLRQILEFDKAARQVRERTFDKAAIRTLQRKLRGVTALTRSWYDFLPPGILPLSSYGESDGREKEDKEEERR